MSLKDVTVVHILEILTKLETFLGYAPFGIGEKGGHVSKKRKFYVIFLILFLIFGITFATYGKINFSYRKPYIYQLSLDIALECMLFFMAFYMCIAANFIYPENYENFFKFLLDVEQIFKSKIQLNTSTRIFYFCQMIGILIAITPSFMYQHYNIQRAGYMIHGSNLIFLNFHYGSYSFMLILMQIILTLVFIGTVCQCVQEQFNVSMKALIRNKRPEGDIVRHIRKTVNVIRKINKLIEEFNIIYGWLIFLYLAYFTVGMFFCIFLMLYSSAVDYNIFAYFPFLVVQLVRG